MPLPVAQPPTGTPPLMLDAKQKPENAFATPWLQWLTALWTAVRGPANTTAPATSAAKGFAGQLAYDQNFLYVYVGTQWKRIPLSSF
jgi:hypothetical protein